MALLLNRSLKTQFNIFLKRGNGRRTVTFTLDPKTVFGNRAPSPQELYAAFVDEIEALAQRDENFDAVIKRALLHGAGHAVTKALLFSDGASMDKVSEFFMNLPPHMVAAAGDLQGARVVDSHEGDSLVCIAVWAFETLRVTLFIKIKL
jgi:hypothetical protein